MSPRVKDILGINLDVDKLIRDAFKQIKSQTKWLIWWAFLGGWALRGLLSPSIYQDWLFAAMTGLTIGMAGGMLVVSWRRLFRGSDRKTDRDSGDTRPSNDPGSTTSGNTGTASTGTGVIATTMGAVAPLMQGDFQDGLPVRQQDEPILAWKVYRLAWQKGRPIGLIGHGGYVDVEDAARCESGYYNEYGNRVHEHKAPASGCSCGFYAYKTDGPIAERGWTRMALCEVELYGRIIVHQDGYRAEKQRILSVSLPSACDYCDEPATVLVAPSAFALATDECRGYDDDGSVMLESRCYEHIHPNDVMFTKEKVAGRLGTEVRWRE